MNEQQARQSGYSFTGVYTRDRGEVGIRRDALTKEGYKAVIVTVPDSPLSRGPKGTGWSVYAERKYFVDKEKTDLRQRLSMIEPRKERAQKKYEEELVLIENDRVNYQNRLDELEKEIVTRP
jgi:hypothetical protein